MSVSNLLMHLTNLDVGFKLLELKSQFGMLGVVRFFRPREIVHYIDFWSLGLLSERNLHG